MLPEVSKMTSSRGGLRGSQRFFGGTLLGGGPGLGGGAGVVSALACGAGGGSEGGAGGVSKGGAGEKQAAPFCAICSSSW
jgi:hypothetical protein